MTKAKVMKILGIGLVILLAVLVFASCTAPAAAPAEQKMMGVIKAVPNTGAPKAKIDYAGANFMPGEKVTVVVLNARGPLELATETVVSGKNIVIGTAAERGMVQADEIGSFFIQTIGLPAEEGTWPVRVYSEDGKLLTSSLVVVKTPEAK